jgi:hypothetical protein
MKITIAYSSFLKIILKDSLVFQFQVLNGNYWVKTRNVHSSMKQNVCEQCTWRSIPTTSIVLEGSQKHCGEMDTHILCHILPCPWMPWGVVSTYARNLKIKNGHNVWFYQSFVGIFCVQAVWAINRTFMKSWNSKLNGNLTLNRFNITWNDLITICKCNVYVCILEL